MPGLCNGGVLLPWRISKHSEMCWCNASLMHNVYPKWCCPEIRRTPTHTQYLKVGVFVCTCVWVLSHNSFNYALNTLASTHPSTASTTEKESWTSDYLPKCQKTISTVYTTILLAVVTLKLTPDHPQNKTWLRELVIERIRACPYLYIKMLSCGRGLCCEQCVCSTSVF